MWPFMANRRGKKWKQWQIFFWGGSKIIVDGYYSHEIRRHLLLERKAMTNSVYHFANKVLYSQSYGFSRSESWTIKKADHWRNDAFELWCWRRLLRLSWTAKWSNQLILNGVDSEYSLEGLMLNLKLHYFGQPMLRPIWNAKTLFIWKDLDAGENWRQKEKGMPEDEMFR